MLTIICKKLNNFQSLIKKKTQVNTKVISKEQSWYKLVPIHVERWHANKQM